METGPPDGPGPSKLPEYVIPAGKLASAPDLPGLSKLPGRATMEGQQYEYKMAGLAAARARQIPGLRFELATNVAGAEPCDDVLLRLRWGEDSGARCLTYLLQLKHSHDAKAVSEQALASDEGDFGIRKYFQVYKRLADLSPWDPKHHPHENVDYLSACPAPDYRFIIYTTKTVPHTATAEGAKEEDFPWSHLWASHEGNGGFCFSEEDGAIWGLLREDPDEDAFRDEFLPRLRIFSAQCSASALDELIQMALQELFGVGPVLGQRLLQRYLSALSAWWRASDGVLWTESSSPLEDIALEEINDIFFKYHILPAITFTPDAHRELAEEIRRNRILVVSVQNVDVQYRSLKLRETMHQELLGKALFVNRNTLVEMHETVHKVSQTLHENDMVLLNLDEVNDSNSSCVTNMILNSRCKFIIVCNNVEDGLNCVNRIPMHVRTLEDKWTLSQLTLEAQRCFLERRVLFQGREMELRALEAAWPALRDDVDGLFLCTLASGGTPPALGTAPPAPGDNINYIPRILEHRTTLSPAVLKVVSDSEHFALSGFPRNIVEDLQEERKILALSNNRGRGFTVFTPEIDDCGLTILSFQEDLACPDTNKDRKAFETLCGQYPSKNIHFISYNNTLLEWVETRGSPSKILPFISYLSPFCQSSPDCIHSESTTNFSEWNTSTTFVIGEPGMGKSMFMRKLAQSTSSDQWRIFVQLGMLRRRLHAMPEAGGIQVEDVFELLAEAADVDSSLSPQCTRAFLKGSLLQSKRISVFIDGLDEICPTYNAKAIRIITLLQELAVSTIWVATRLHLGRDLLEIFHCQPLTLKPFSKEDQLKHVCHVLSRASVNEVDDNLPERVKSIMNSMNESAGSNYSGYCIWDIPLHAQLFAETFSETTRKFQHSEENVHFSILRLYEGFVEKKRSMYEKKFGFDDADSNSPIVVYAKSLFIEVHELCALMTVGGLENLLDGKVLSYSLRKYRRAFHDENTGIVNWENGAPQFIHYSFAEFFAALWLKDNYKEEKLTESIWQSFSPMLLYFFSAMLAADHDLHTAALHGDTQYINFILHSQGTDHKVQEQDEGGRTALHVAAIHNHTDVCRLLLEAGCDLHKRDEVFSWKALQYADIALNAGPANVLLGQGGDKEDIKTMLQENISNGAMFRLAARSGYIHLVQFFVNTKDDVRLSSEEKRKCTNEGSSNSQGITPLHCAAYAGFTETVRTLATAANVDVQSLRKWTPLHFAAQEGHLDVINELLSKGAHLDAVTDKGLSPLYFSAENGHTSVVELLINKGSHVSIADNFKGWRPLHCAALQGHSDVVALLLARDAPVDVSDKDKNIPLHLAAREGREECVNVLLAFGSPINAVTNCGETPLHSAVWKGHVNIVRMLIAKGANVNAADNNNGLTPLHYAAMQGHKEIVELLLGSGAIMEARAERGYTPLLFAAHQCHENVVDLLLARGANVGAISDKGTTALHRAVRTRSLHISKALLNQKADVNATNVEGWSPLHYAAFEGYDDIAKELLKFGALVGIRSALGLTPLHLASCKGHDVSLLLSHGASPDAVSNQGFTALHSAARNGNVSAVEALLAEDADVSLEDFRGRTPLHHASLAGHVIIAQRLLTYGADVNAKARDSSTPLYLAALKGHGAVAEVLIAEGGSVTTTTTKGYTPLHAASAAGHLDVVKLLVDRRASVNLQGEDGKTALYFAALGGHEGVVGFLLGRGADAKLASIEGDTPRDAAEVMGNMGVVELLTGREVPQGNEGSVTDLHIAAVEGHCGGVRRLLEAGADVDAVTAGGATPLYAAAAFGRADTVKLLLARGARVVGGPRADGLTPLHAAARSGSAAATEAVLEAGAPVDARAAGGETALAAAAAAAAGRLETVALLLSRGADASLCDARGRTALDAARENAHEDVALILGHSCPELWN